MAKAKANATAGAGRVGTVVNNKGGKKGQQRQVDLRSFFSSSPAKKKKKKDAAGIGGNEPSGGGTTQQPKMRPREGVRSSPRRNKRGHGGNSNNDGEDEETPTVRMETTATATPTATKKDRQPRPLPSVTPTEKGEEGGEEGEGDDDRNADQGGNIGGIDEGDDCEKPPESSPPASAAKTPDANRGRGDDRRVTPGGSTTKRKEKTTSSKMDVVVEEEEEDDGGVVAGGEKSASRKSAASVGGIVATGTKLKPKSTPNSNSKSKSISKSKSKSKPLKTEVETNKRKRKIIVDEESSSEEEEFDDEQQDDEEEGGESSYEPTQSSDEEENSDTDSDEDEEGDLMDSDDSADEFVPMRKPKGSSKGRLTMNKRSTGGDDDDDGEEKKEEEGPPPKKARKLAKGWSFLAAAPAEAPKRKRATSTKRAQQQKSDKPASARSSNKFVYDAGDDLPVLVHPQDMFDDMVSEQLTRSGTLTGPLDDFVAAMRGRTLRVATMCSGTESPVLALDMLSKSIDDFYYRRHCGAVGEGGDEKHDKKRPGSGLLKVEHVFSCEIEPFKQAYIERNFRPPLLFRDVRELGNSKATTAYGALVDVPNEPGSVDLLVAGTSCVDYSNLNNEKKTIDQSGESGQTFRGMMEWVTKSECPLVILENVSGAPWDKKVEMFDDMGYDAEFVRVDTKAYYIPHTRQRGYLFAIRRGDAASGAAAANGTKKKKKAKQQSDIVQEWKATVEGLARPASGALDDFMLSNDDPRVARGRARLSTSSTFSSGDGAQGGNDRAGRTDWTRCEARHQLARSQEALGDRRPLTGWSDAGNTSMPTFAWNEWVNGQVHRIHDLMDINTLRLAKDGRDCTYKTMVWNLSQNVDRDTMGKLGLCMCLTPTGVPYVTNRGGPLVGEELLLLQGIPADDLLLTRETEENLKDLAGNAMSTTVVGACMLSALILGHGALGNRPARVGEIVHNLVPRPLAPASTTGDSIVISQSMGRYRSKPLRLGPSASAPFGNLSDLLSEASSAARKCILEGSDRTLRPKELLRCVQCGHTSSVEGATPPRKYEEHDLRPVVDASQDRVRPDDFRQRLLDQLPMEIVLDKLTATDKDVPSSMSADIDTEVWSQWKRALSEATTPAAAAEGEDGGDDDSSGAGQPALFRFSQMSRSHYWTVRYVANTEARLELRIMDTGATWFLFAKAPSARGKLRDALERPVARMRVVDGGDRPGDVPASLLAGEWEVCLPFDCPVDVRIGGLGGERVPTWESSLGLRNEFEGQERYSRLRITVESSGHSELKKLVDGEYQLLPKCGTACSSLHKRVVVAGDDSSNCTGDNNNMWFFLESGRRTMPDQDAFVFSTTKHRTNYREYRDVVLAIDPKEKYRPIAPPARNEEDGDEQEEDTGKTVRAYMPGMWTRKPLACAVSAPEYGVCAKNKRSSKQPHSSSTIVMPAPGSELTVPMQDDGWRFSPQIILATVPVQTDMKLYRDCVAASFLASTGTGEDSDNPWMDVNLQKSKFVFNSLAFVTSRISVPTVVSEKWIPLENKTITKDGEQRPCTRCAPEKPKLKWTTVTKGKKQLYVPKEDVKEAAMYEQSLKNRPHPWVVRLRTIQGDAASRNGDLQLSVGCNAVSLTQRSMGLLPRCTLARTSMLELVRSSPSSDNCSADNVFDFRILQHVEKASTETNFPKMCLVSNKKDKEADQPPNFKKFPLRHEQLRSLTWMLAQEATTDPFWEEEVSESCLPGLNWRAEGRFRRPVMTRGGIIADEVGYGKTAITLGLIDSQKNGPRPPPPREFGETHIHAKATLVVVPSHLMGQWPKEVKKFLGTSVNPLVIKDMTSFNNVTVQDIVRANLVIVNFTVLSNDKYFARLARLAGVNASSLPSGKTGGRHFESLHEESTTKLGTRVKALHCDCSSVFDDIEDDAVRNAVEERRGSSVRLDGKKSVYKNVSEEATKKTAGAGVSSDAAAKSPKASKQSRGGGNGKLRKDGVNDKLSKPDRDPWGLRQCGDVQKMKCPPLEMFFWDRLVIDEFHYLAEKANRGRVLTLVRRLNSTYRWALSGTPPHANFNDVQTLSNLIGIHLGVDEALPGAKVARRGGGGSGGEGEKTDMEKFASLLESHSLQWHERRHTVAQDFLHRFVRQNIAEIDEIPCEEHVQVVTLPPAERGIYLELATALQSLEMNSKRALKSKKSMRGDRELRMQEILEGSADAEEALLKRCTHFDLSHGSSSALEACERVIKLRKEEKDECTKELMNNIVSALRQRLRILDHDKNWEGTKKTEKGEVEDRLAQYINDAMRHDSVSGGADKEVHEEILAILKDAQEEVKLHPRKYDARYAEVNGDDIDDDEGAGAKKRKPSEKKERRAKVSEDTLYAMKFALREHLHEVRSLGKELCGRTRSYRYFKWVRDFQLEKDVKCPSCKTGEVLKRECAGVLSSCGHVGCLKCLHTEADGEKCIDKTCSAPVKTSNVVSAVELGVDGDHNAGGSYGAKLTEIVRNIKGIVRNGDRVIVFVQFRDLKQKVAEALEKNGVKTLQVKGTVSSQVKALDVLQKEKPDKIDPRVLLLTMDDESSAGVNLTTCNHAVFVHPLLADTQQQYDAYETQAIGRIRRYGQSKTVNIWRYFASSTIDTEIFKQRTGRDLDKS